MASDTIVHIIRQHGRPLSKERFASLHLKTVSADNVCNPRYMKTFHATTTLRKDIRQLSLPTCTSSHGHSHHRYDSWQRQGMLFQTNLQISPPIQQTIECASIYGRRVCFEAANARLCKFSRQPKASQGQGSCISDKRK